ncbi:hypothetical protein AB0J74_14460 [Asanoa sp. NPDC049573]|uniref:hypothetical protein n=1 Tax=Asanoa sp. NPDC049573 TaxID=3155396 RepID=UPI0034242942
MRRKLVTVLSALLLALPAAVFFGAPAQAAAKEPPAGCRYFHTVNPYYGDTCYEWDGDDQWVYDGVGDGWSARVEIETLYGKVRWCANTETAGHWVECTFDHEEGSCVHFRMYEQDGGDNGPTRYWTDWTPWISTSTGADC